MMKLGRLTLCAVLASTAFACAADRAKEARSADADLAAQEQQAREDQARLHDKQVREQAEAQQRQMKSDDRAELNTKQAEERAETMADGQKDIANAEKNATTAHAGLENERAKVEADAKARFKKVDAKAYELENGKVKPEKKAKFNAELNAYKAKKVDVQTRILNLPQAPDAQWNAEKAKLEKGLDDLESSVQRLDSSK